MVVNAYNIELEGDLQLTDCFKLHEFQCKNKARVVLVCTDLVNMLTDARHYFNKPLHINSAYRTPEYNASVKDSSPNSKHMLGIAADIWVEGVTMQELYDFFDKRYPNSLGLGIYNTFVHLDTRRVKARWDYRENRK